MCKETMPLTRSNGLRGTRRRTGYRRRRYNAASKVRFQRPSARNQKKQIYRNTRLLDKVARVQRSNRIYTDWHMSGILPHTATGTWGTAVLTDFSNWTNVLRQSPVVVTSTAATFVRNMVLNLRFNLGTVDYVYVSLFVVTMRRHAAGIDPHSVPPGQNTEWIEPTGVQGANLRLNPAIYKVHYAKYLTLTNNALGHAAVTAATAGNPNTTWRKASVNLPVKMRVNNPALYTPGHGSWTKLPYQDLPYYNRYYLMAYMTFGGTGTILPSISYDALSTCINTM